MEAGQKNSVIAALEFVEAAEKGYYASVEEALKSSTHGNAEVPLLPGDGFRLQGLARAAENNHDKVVELILNRWPHIRLEGLMDKVAKDLDITLLHMAAWTGQVAVVQRLLRDAELGRDVNARTRGGITPLQMASFRGHAATVKALLECPQVQLDAVTAQERFTALHMAADGGHAQVVHALLSACRGMQGKVSMEDFINATDCLLRTALHYACRNGHSAVVQILLAAPEIDVNPEDAIASFTPLHLACWTPGDHVDVVKLIIAHAHVEVNVRIGHCNKDEAALREKQKEKEEKQKQREMEKEKEQAEGGRREEKQREREMEMEKQKEKEMKMEKEKMKQKEMEMEKVQVKVKAALEEKENVAWNLLRPRLVDATVHSTMDFENKGFPKKGDTPLHLAAEVGNGLIVTQLLQHESIQVNAAEDQYGMTALHAAALWGGNLDVLTELLSNQEVNVKAETKGLRFYPDRYAQCEAMNVLHIAVYRGHLEMVERLMSTATATALLLNKRTGDCNFILNGHYYTGLTSLHIAAYFGHKDICTVLLNQADVTVNPRTGFHILKNAEGCCSNSQEQKEDKLTTEWLHKTAASNQLSLVKQMLGIDRASVDQVVTLLTGPRVGGGRLDTFRQFIVREDTEKNGSAKVDLEALIKDLDMDPRIAPHVKPAGFRRLQHADRCYSDMTPLHIAAHRGHLHVLTLMLNSPSPTIPNFQANTGETILHIAIHERRMRVIKWLCDHPKLQADVEDNAGKNAVELVYGLLLERKTEKQAWQEKQALQEKQEKQAWQEVMDCLLARKDVTKFINTLNMKKKGFQDAANALMVGGTLIASVTFGSFLQPPIGSAFDSYRRSIVTAFWSFNTLSFFFAVCTVVMSIRIVMPKPEQFIKLELENLSTDVTFTTFSLGISTCFVILAFVMTGVGNLPPKALGSMLLSTVLGGLFTLFFGVIPLFRDWFEALQKYRQDSSLKLLIEWIKKLAGPTFSKRNSKEPDVGPEVTLDEPTIKEEPPRPKEFSHPHQSLPTWPQPSIFSVKPTIAA